jgi:hypothetical protein
VRAILTTPQYFSARQKDKYLLVLAAVAKDVGSQKFSELQSFQFGSRPYFASKRGASSQDLQELDEIPETEVLALTSLGGPRKAHVLRKVLDYFGYSQSDIDAATSDYPAAKRKNGK